MENSTTIGAERRVGLMIGRRCVITSVVLCTSEAVRAKLLLNRDGK